MGELIVQFYYLLLPSSVTILVLFLLFDHLITIDHRITFRLVQQEDKKEMIDSIWTLGAETTLRVGDSGTVREQHSNCSAVAFSALSVSATAVSVLAFPTIPLYLPSSESSIWPQCPCRCRHPSPSHRLELASQPGPDCQNSTTPALA